MDRPTVTDTTAVVDAAEEENLFEHVPSHIQTTTHASMSPTTTSLWNSYGAFVHRHQVPLELLDAGLSRILFWAPTVGNNSVADRQHRQREVLYGILSLHRLAMDTALQQQQQRQLQLHTRTRNDGSRNSSCQQPGGLPIDYGMSVRPNDTTVEDDTDISDPLQAGISPTTIRIAITVVQSLLPSILEVSQSSSLSEQQNRLRRGRARLNLERIKLVLRLYLLGSYWKRLLVQHQLKRKRLLEQGEPEHSIPPLSVGIMTEAGLFHGIDYTTNSNHAKGNGNGGSDYAPTTAQEDSLWRRRKYVGRRTGRTVLRPSLKGKEPSILPTDDGSSSTSTNTFASRIMSAYQNNNHNLQSFSVVIGELLNAYRPLYWAEVEASGATASYRSWMISIIMDLVTLQMCRANHSTSVNPATQTEMSRRRMRLLLYLLRSPVWDRWTEPASDRVEGALEKVPVLGRLTSTHLRNYLWFMKHPYESEKG